MKRSPLFAVFIVVLIDLMGFGIVLPLLPFYASEFHASSTSIGLLYSIYSLAQLVFSPIWGSLSDRIGRRPIMLMSTFGASLAYLLFAFSHSFAILFASRLLAGIMGGNISTAYAYVTDVTRPEDRAKGMGMIGAAFGIGFVLGPAMASLLIHPAFLHQLENSSHLAVLASHPYMLPGFFASFMSLLSLTLVLFKLPETVVKTGKTKGEPFLKTGIFSKNFWKTIFANQNAAHPYLFGFLILCVFLLSFGQSSLYSAFPLFCEARLGLSAHDVGLQFGLMGLIAIFIQGGLIRVLTKRFKEESLFLTGTIGFVIGIALIPFSSSVLMLTLFLSLLAIGASLCMPTLNSLVSKQAASDNVGATLGTSQSISGLGRVVGPTWGGALYAIGFRIPFLLTALVVSVMCAVAVRLKRKS